ncbi:hypothetical protein ACH41E_09195 [Streptomyces sp. NPDC020412]|uniref:hypothetical protein n=1 Tax=Streptomyces sp. NPDC020412 TaxID=3365073 RepID=UPI0037A226F6
MRLAIGDVVRDRRERVIGTVVGIDPEGYGSLVALRVSTGTTHLAYSDDLEMLARNNGPTGLGRRVLAVVLFVLAALTAFAASHTVHSLGGNWALMIFSALGAYTAFDVAFRGVQRLTGPRRIRV